MYRYYISCSFKLSKRPYNNLKLTLLWSIWNQEKKKSVFIYIYREKLVEDRKVR